jgi:hypothetical protein
LKNLFHIKEVRQDKRVEGKVLSKQKNKIKKGGVQLPMSLQDWKFSGEMGLQEF